MLEDPDHKSEAVAHAERRRSVRICCTGFAEGVARNPSQLFRGEIRNLSETGCFISLKATVSLTPDSIVELRFKFGGAAYCALARVVEAKPSIGIRMRFIATDPAFTDRIRRILSVNSPSH